MLVFEYLIIMLIKKRSFSYFIIDLKIVKEVGT